VGPAGGAAAALIPRRARVRRLAAAALVLAAAGCGRGERGSAVVLWAMGREGEAVPALLPEFERAHPDVRVRVQQIPWSAAHEKLLTAFVGDALPDVFQAGSTWLAELAVLGAAEPLEPTSDPDDWFPGILDANVVEGATLGVPWYVDTRLLFYRRDLVPEAPRTWDAWLAAMTRAKARAGPDGWAIVLPSREWEPPVILALQAGGTLLRDGDTRGNFRSAGVRAGFAFYTDLFRRGLAPRSGETATANVYQDFARGFFVFFVTGPWNLGEFARRLPPDMQPRWATAPWPAPAGAPWPGVSLAGGSSLVVARTSRRKAAARALVAYLTAPAQQARFYGLTGDLPARLSAWGRAGLHDDPRARAFWIQLQSVRSTPKIPEWERIAAKIGQWAEAAARDEMTTDQALTALDRDVDDVLAKRRWLLGRREAGE